MFHHFIPYIVITIGVFKIIFIKDQLSFFTKESLHSTMANASIMIFELASLLMIENISSNRNRHLVFIFNSYHLQITTV